MNINIPVYLVFICGGSLLCCLLYLLTSKSALKLSGSRAAALSGLTLLFGSIFGLAGAKILYLLFRFSYLLKTGVFSYLFSLRYDELSFYGGVAGAAAGAALAARVVNIKPAKVLNAFAAPGALLVALFRFAEYWLGSLGTGDYIEDPLPFPLAVSEVWNPDFPEYYLAVFMLEGVVCLRIALFAFQNRRDSLCFLRTVFYLSLSQILCESLRAQSIRWLFVRYEQLLCYLVAEGILVWYAIIAGKHKRWNWGAAIGGLVVCGLTVLEEFMLDGKVNLSGFGIPPIAIYLFMAWTLLELAVAEHKARNRLPESSNQAAKTES